MAKQNLATELVDYVLHETKNLDDEEYLNVLETVVSDLEDYITAKHEEMRNDEA